MSPCYRHQFGSFYIPARVVLDLGQLRAIFQSGSLRGICLIPGHVYAPAVAVRALPRVSAQLSTSARDRGWLARRGAGIARAGQFRWAGSLGSEVAGPWSSRGSRVGILLHQVAWRLLIRLADSQLKFLGAEIAASEL